MFTFNKFQNALRHSVWFLLTGFLFINSDLGHNLKPMISESMPASGIDSKNLAVVINDQDPYSVEIGTFYVKERLIPSSQVIHISLPTGVSELPVSQFRWILRDVNKRVPSIFKRLHWLGRNPIALAANRSPAPSPTE